MRAILRVALAAALILTDATQSFSALAASLDDNALGAYQARMKRTLDRDEATWKRLSNSICTGCGSAPKPLIIAPPAFAAAASPGTETPAGKVREPAIAEAATQPRSRSALQQRSRARYASARRQVRSHTRLTSRARRHARYALLRRVRDERRIARSAAQYASRLPRITRSHRRTRLVAATGNPLSLLQSNWVSPRDRGYPLPRRSRQRLALCAYDRGFFSVVGLWPNVCVAGL
jgi:hypothetical protein